MNTAEAMLESVQLDVREVLALLRPSTEPSVSVRTAYDWEDVHLSDIVRSKHRDISTEPTRLGQLEQQVQQLHAHVAKLEAVIWVTAQMVAAQTGVAPDALTAQIVKTLGEIERRAGPQPALSTTGPDR